MLRSILSTFFYLAILVIIVFSFNITTIDGESINGNENSSYIMFDGGILIGADGEYITITNNPDATNPTWDELKAFLLADQTD